MTKLAWFTIDMLLMGAGIALLIWGVTTEHWGAVPGALIAAYFGARDLEEMGL